MARVFIDGFESGGLGCWDGAAQVNVVTSPVRSGTYAAYFPYASYPWLTKYLPDGDYYIAFKYMQENTGGRNLLWVREGATTHIRIDTFTSGGNFSFLAWSGSNIIYAPGLYNANTWYLVEIYFSVHDSTGRVTIKIDGITQGDYTGDTRQGGTGVIDRICLGQEYAYEPNAWFDDFILDDSNWIGDTAVLGLAPSGAGNSAQWDPSTGANYSCVDEVPASDTDYVSTNVNDEIDTYALADLPASPSIKSVKCVQVMARARKEGASTPQKIALVVRAGTTDYASGDKTLATSFGSHLNIWTQNPDTAAAWTESGVNGIEAGVKARA